MGSSEGQTYCLRWNNHKSNLVEILDALIKMESYVDCTIVVDDQVQFKAHRVVLAANSPYFQSILQDVPMDHCSILFPGVQAFEMRALLEYMYTGEVNVTQSQIPKIMKIAEQLEVKGLFDMTDLKEKFNKFDEPLTNYPPPPTPTTPAYTASKESELQSSPIITTSTNVTSAQSSSSSPPYSYKSPYSSLYSKSPGPSTSDRHSQWPPISPHLPTTIPSAAAAAMLSSVYESAADMNPLKRKKLSSLSSMLQYPTPKDTPILRNVLAQSHAADSSQPMPLICQPVKTERSEQQGSSGSCNGSEFTSDKKQKYDEPHSPYTDKSFEDDGLDCPPSYLGDSRLPQYGQQQQQKPEWKRYKQYTRSDILSAIECVRNGMSALQASRKYGVPSRTLYDKVKKLGITTGRPMNRTIKRSPSSSSSTSGFQFGMGGSSHPYASGETMISQIHEPMEREKDREHHIPPTIPHPAAALLDPNFLQQAFEARGGDIAGREALHAMALAAAAHAAVNGMSTSPGTNGTARSPSPGMLKYQKPQSPHVSHERDQVRERERDRERERERERELEQEQEHMDEEEDKVEDLSMSRKELTPPPIPAHHSYHSQQHSTQQQQQQQQQHQQTGVIVPPMTKLATKSSEEYGNMECKRECLTEDSRD